MRAWAAVGRHFQTFFEFAQKLTRALVSARKAIAIYEQKPPWRAAESPRSLPEHGDLVDEETGFVAHEGQLTIVVSPVPEDTSALADRLGGWPEVAISAATAAALAGVLASAALARRRPCRGRR